jgi:hypothetical protein
MKGRIGTSTQRSNLLPLNPKLAAPSEPAKRKIYLGAKPYVQRGPTPEIPDEKVIEVRRLKAWWNLSTKEIAARTGINETRVRGFLTYTTRAHLEPGPKPANAKKPS